MAWQAVTVHCLQNHFRPANYVLRVVRNHHRSSSGDVNVLIRLCSLLGDLQGFALYEVLCDRKCTAINRKQHILLPSHETLSALASPLDRIMRRRDSDFEAHTLIVITRSNWCAFNLLSLAYFGKVDPPMRLECSVPVGHTRRVEKSYLALYRGNMRKESKC